MTTAQTVPERRTTGRTAAGALAVLGPLSIAVAPLFLPYPGFSETSEMVADSVAASGKLSVYVLSNLLSAILYVPAVVLIGLVALAGARRTAGAGLALFAVGAAAQLTLLMSQDVLLLAAAEAGVDQAVTVKILDDGVAASPVLTWPSLLAIAGLIAPVVIGVALARSGRVPAWAGWVFAASVPVLVAGQATGTIALLVLGGVLQTVTGALVAQRIVREGTGWTRA
ncbi:hypothetical protein [Actinocorallia sp. A-T 12471]|uniref:hypothetical protein n=1 Tax=Actinocorallia sp. A-T 12471 TaxID=3089813 RepID=UPI0029CFBE16|nr:hypothetical protein [Actinocorallia sp. A-T 12471]MDX6739607.1 hypothetical protein [Actinocorallia sp. A-T 12471]